MEEDILCWWMLGFSCHSPKELAELVGSDEAAPEGGGDWTDSTKVEWAAASQCASGKAARESI